MKSPLHIIMGLVLVAALVWAIGYIGTFPLRHPRQGSAPYLSYWH